MTNSNIPKVITKGTTEMRSSGGLSAANTQNPRCHSRVVKSSMYYQSSVVPSRGKHKQGEGSILAAESGDKNKMRGNKQTERAVGRPSPQAALPIGRQASGSPSLKQNQSRSSPSKEERSSPGSSPTLGCFYAGAKFSAPPMPEAIPRPPSHWTTSIRMSSGGVFPLFTGGQDPKSRHEINSSLKMLLNVPA